ncbi:MAG TPA: MoxR family ATPase [bacterium]|nr:MoxR family ATPase [bacterium]
MSTPHAGPRIPQPVLTHTVTTGELIGLIAGHTRNDWTPDAPGLLVIGPPGGGKTAGARQAAELLSRDLGEPVGLKDVRLTEVTPIDIIGLPEVDKETHRTRWAASELLPGPNDPARGLIVFDELPNAAPAVQTAVYKAMTEHMVGPHVLPKGWWVVLMGNRMADRGNVFPIPKPLVNRVTVLEVQPTLDDWLSYALPRGLAPEVHAYLRQHPQHFLEMDYSPDPIPYPTPRSWTYLSWHVRRLREAGLTTTALVDALRILAQGQVGPGVGTQFCTYTQLFDQIPDAEAIMRGAASPEPPTEMDAAWALVAALIGHIPTAATLRYFVEYLSKLPGELQVYAVRSAVLSHHDRTAVTRRFEAPDTKLAWNAWCAANKGFLGAIAAHDARRSAA